MKFDEMNEKQQDAFKTYYLNVLNIKSQEEQRWSYEFFRLLVIANGTGVFLLTTFMGAIARSAGQVTLLRTPLIIFLIGTVAAALVYFPLANVASQATPFMEKQILDFFLNKKDSDEITGYGLNRIGCFLVALLLITSLVLFVIGVVRSVSALGKLS